MIKDLSPADRIISKALDTEIGRQFLNEFKGVLSKILVFGSIALTLFLMYKFHSLLSVLGREDNISKIGGG